MESAGGDWRMRAALEGEPNLRARRADRDGDGMLCVCGLVDDCGMSV